MTALAAAGLLGLATACSSAADDTGTSTSADAAPAATKVATSDSKMKDGCDAVHQLFAALDNGDQAGAESLLQKSNAAFKDVVKTQAADKQLASNATAMADMLDFGLPEKPIYQSELAEVYAVDCVAQYGAPALAG